MFPYHSRLTWHARTGYLHLVEAIEDHTKDFTSPFSEILERRADRIRAGLKVRLGVLVLLNLGLLATGFAWIATILPVATEVRELVQSIAQALTGVSILLTGAFLVISRYLGQLQADIVAAMALGTGWPPGSDFQAQRLEEAMDPDVGGWTEPIDDEN